MAYFISKDKMSKKTKRELNSAKRMVWDFKPVTRIKPSAKVYNRKRMQNDY